MTGEQNLGDGEPVVINFDELIPTPELRPVCKCGNKETKVDYRMSMKHKHQRRFCRVCGRRWWVNKGDKKDVSNDSEK